MAWNSWRKILTYLFLYSLQSTEEEKEEKDQHAALRKAKQNNVTESPAPKPRYANNEWTSCLSASCYWRQHGDAFSGSSCVTFASSCNSKQQAKESGKHWTADCYIKIAKRKRSWVCVCCAKLCMDVQRSCRKWSPSATLDVNCKRVRSMWKVFIERETFNHDYLLFFFLSCLWK